MTNPTRRHATLYREALAVCSDHGVRGKLARVMFGPDLDDCINQRAAILARLHTCRDSEGMVGLVESGRDCDGVQYSGKWVGTIPATLIAYFAEMDRISRWADGPFALSIVPPSMVDQIHYESRDRVLEAFENGHPHSI